MTNFAKELEEQGIIAFTNKGISMMPLLRQDKDIMVIRAKKSDFQLNDAVLFTRPNGQYILHRITKILPDKKYFIIGDNCISGETVDESRIIGVLTEVKRDGRTISCESEEYKKYVRSVPLRRAFFKPYRTVKSAVRKPLAKIYRKYFKRKK